jgi:hypothetical protein
MARFYHPRGGLNAGLGKEKGPVQTIWPGPEEESPSVHPQLYKPVGQPVKYF